MIRTYHVTEQGGSQNSESAGKEKKEVRGGKMTGRGYQREEIKAERGKDKRHSGTEVE